jgi:hypothetical protein
MKQEEESKLLDGNSSCCPEAHLQKGRGIWAENPEMFSIEAMIRGSDVNQVS